jgi:hypothetical protein
MMKLHSPFDGLSWREVGIVALVGMGIAILVVAVVAAIVMSLPISDASKYKALFGLGMASLFTGYWVLTRRRIPPKSQTRKPATVSPTTHSKDVCNGSSEINRNLCQYPAQPSQAIAINSAPTRKQTKTTSAILMATSLLTKKFSDYKMKVIDWGLR